MANLFFVHTPLELMMAQQVINFEKLEDNFLLYGYQGGNTHYLEIYDVIIVNSFWHDRIRFDPVDVWAELSRKHLCQSMRKVRERYCFIADIIKRYSVDTLFLGDLNNFSCKFSSVLFHKKGCRICFFEEGAGHYNYHPKSHTPKFMVFDKLLGIIADRFLYLPFFGFKFGAYCFWKDLYFEQLPIDVRYSVRPHYNEKYDKLLKVEPIISPKLKDIIYDDIKSFPEGRKVLFLNTPIYSVMEDDSVSKQVYIQLLDRLFSSADKSLIYMIKFHPSDGHKERQLIIDLLIKNKLCYAVLSHVINVPIECYLQTISFDYVFTFGSATIYYNGYFYPKIRIVSLLELFYEMCFSQGVKDLSYLKDLVNGENQLIKDDQFIERYNFNNNY